MPEQLFLDLAGKPALGRGDFLVAPSNALAVHLIETWRDWTQGKLVVSGPAGAGKTHLAHVWAALATAEILSANRLLESDVPRLARGPVAIEDVPTIRGNAEAETALFHLHNLMRENRQALLLTGTGSPAAWGLTLPDLQSRVAGAPEATLTAPDDTLLAAVMAKQFADRQIVPKPDVIPYLLAHMDRSFAASRTLVEALDRESLRQKRAVTRPLAARVLESLAAPEDQAD